MKYEVTPVLCNEKNMANYAYIVHTPNRETTIVVDAAEANPTIAALERLKLHPSFILTTHHHFDHVEGNLKLKEKYGARIVAPEKEFAKVPGADIPAAENTPLLLNNMKFTVINAPGHTLGHVLYYLPGGKMLFTGDVLFNLCIGGLFEGTVEEMWGSLQRIKKLPDDTLFYPGHEYTLYGLNGIYGPAADRYAAKAEARLREGLPAAPFTLGEEKVCNPYLACRNLGEFYQIMGS